MRVSARFCCLIKSVYFPVWSICFVGCPDYNWQVVRARFGLITAQNDERINLSGFILTLKKRGRLLSTFVSYILIRDCSLSGQSLSLDSRKLNWVIPFTGLYQLRASLEARHVCDACLYTNIIMVKMPGQLRILSIIRLSSNENIINKLYISFGYDQTWFNVKRDRTM